MADNKYYAWSPIRGGDGMLAQVGDEVSAKSLDISEDDFQEMIQATAVRSRPYPVPKDRVATHSPNQHIMDLLAQAQEDAMASVEVPTLSDIDATVPTSGPTGSEGK